MEENSNMTAERSLEIITEQIERSRQIVSKTTGQSLFIAGLCTMGMAIIVAFANIYWARNGMMGIGHLLWFLLPVVIWLISRKNIKGREHTPMSLVGTLVEKTWSTFAIFVLGFFLFACIWHFIAARLLSPSDYILACVRVTPVIVLLMGMSITITGHILKQRWLVIFGIVAGLVFFLWEFFGMGQRILMNLTGMPPSLPTTVASIHSLPSLTIFMFAFIGMVLPGMKLKKQSL